MPFGSEGQEEGIGLSLSGGGFRAMLFHVGATWRLNELGLLTQLKRISAVSGGSIVLGRLAVMWPELQFDRNGVAENYARLVAEPVLAFSSRRLDLAVIAKGLLPGTTASQEAAKAYKDLVGSKTFQDLVDAPRFVFNATHHASGTNWRFSKPYMGSYRLGLVRNPQVEIATTIAASAAFPPFLSPLTLRVEPQAYEAVDGADLYPREELRRTVSLTDGGVYDNLGIETVWMRYRTVFASDAGGRLPVTGRTSWDPVSEAKRALDVAREQCGALRRLGLVRDFETSPERNGALWMTAMRLARYAVKSPFPVVGEWSRYIAGIPTRLWPFSEVDRRRLVNWGYVVADVAIRSWAKRHMPPLMEQVPRALPYPDSAFDTPPVGKLPDLGGPDH